MASDGSEPFRPRKLRCLRCTTHHAGGVEYFRTFVGATPVASSHTVGAEVHALSGLDGQTGLREPNGPAPAIWSTVGLRLVRPGDALRPPAALRSVPTGTTTPDRPRPPTGAPTPTCLIPPGRPHAQRAPTHPQPRCCHEGRRLVPKVVQQRRRHSDTALLRNQCRVQRPASQSRSSRYR